MNAILKKIISGDNGNNLLCSLKNKDRELLLPDLKLISIEAGKVIYEPGDEVKYAYFPCGSALISFQVLLDDAKCVETALIGREGAAGGIISEGRLPAYCRMVVQFSGDFLRIETLKLEKAKAQSHALLAYFSRYADCLLAQIFQSVACNASHTIEQRTAKWLVSALERTGEHILPLAQEQLASMLGVGRSYIARVIGGLKKRGILETIRGKLKIHEPKKLEKISCNCNHSVKQHFETVLSGIYPG